MDFWGKPLVSWRQPQKGRTSIERKSYATSEQTKRALADALKEMMTQKPFNKISIHNITHRTIERVGAEIGAADSIIKADTGLLTHFYVVAMAGVVEEWVVGRLDRTPEELSGFTDQFLQDHTRGAMERFRKNRVK